MTASNAAPTGSGRPTLPNAIGIPIVALLILIFVFVGFPWDSLARRVAYEMSRASGAEVSIVSLSPSISARGPVLRARDVVIEHPAVDRVHLRELEIAPRFSTSWFTGQAKLRVWADSDLGLVDGLLGIGSASSFTGDVRGVQLERLPLRTDASGVRLAGKLDATMDMNLAPNGTLAGRVEFESASLVVESDTLPIPLAFSRADGVIVILESGATQIETLNVEGALVEGQLSGEIGLVHRSQSPPVDLEARLRIVDPTLRGLAPGAGLPITPQGNVDVRVRGTLDAPRIERVAATARTAANPRRAPGAAR